MMENKPANLVKMNETNRKILHSRPKIMLSMIKMTGINSEMTEKLRPNSDIWPKFLSEKINLGTT